MSSHEFNLMAKTLALVEKSLNVPNHKGEYFARIEASLQRHQDTLQSVYEHHGQCGVRCVECYPPPHTREPRYESGRCHECGEWLAGTATCLRGECGGCQATRMAWEARLNRERNEQRWAESEKEM